MLTSVAARFDDTELAIIDDRSHVENDAACEAAKVVAFVDSCVIVDDRLATVDEGTNVNDIDPDGCMVEFVDFGALEDDKSLVANPACMLPASKTTNCDLRNTSPRIDIPILELLCKPP